MEIVEIYQLRRYGQKCLSIYKGLDNVKKIDDLFNIIELYQGLICDTGKIIFSSNMCDIEELKQNLKLIKQIK